MVGYLPFNGNFNPFFAVSTYDMDVVMLTGVSLFTTDRTGGIVFNGIEERLYLIMVLTILIMEFQTSRLIITKKRE